MKLTCKVTMFLILSTALIISVNAVEQQVFVLTLNYDNGVVSLDGIFVTQGFFNERTSSEGAYKLEVISFDGGVLYSERFNFNLNLFSSPLPEWFDESGEQIYIPSAEESFIVLTETTKELVIPYFPNAKQINVYDEIDKKLLEIPVLQFADTCGNAICEPQESYESCQLDCRSGSADDYCDGVADNICDPDCSVFQSLDSDCIRAAKTKLTIIDQNLKLFFTLVGISGLLVTAIVLFVKSRHRKEEMDGMNKMNRLY